MLKYRFDYEFITWNPLKEDGDSWIVTGSVEVEEEKYFLRALKKAEQAVFDKHEGPVWQLAFTKRERLDKPVKSKKTNESEG